MRCRGESGAPKMSCWDALPQFSLLCSLLFRRLLLKVLDLLPQGPVTVEQLQQVEQVVQDVIKRNEVVHMAEVPLTLARRVQGLRAVDEV